MPHPKTSGSSMEKSRVFPIIAALFGFCLAASHPASVYFEIFGARTFPLVIMVGVFFFSLPFTLQRFKPAGLHYLYLLLAIWMAIGLVYTGGRNYGTTKLLQVTLSWLLLGLALYHLIPTEKALRFFFFGLLAGSFIVLGLTVLIYGNPLELIHHTTRFFRLQLGTDKDNPIFFARVLGLGVLSTLWLMLTYRRAHILAVGIPISLLVLGYMFLTGSKGPLLALVFGILIGSMYLNTKAKFLVAIFLGVTLLVGVTIIGTTSADFISQRFDQSSGTGISVSSRMRSYTAATEFLFQKAGPMQLLFGVGTGGYGTVMGEGDIRTYAHNIILEIATENGLVGCLLLLVILSLPMLQFHRFFTKRVKAMLSIERRVLLVSLFVGYVAALVNAQFSADIGTNYWIAVFGTLLVRAINTIRKALTREYATMQATHREATPASTPAPVAPSPVRRPYAF